MEKLLKDLSPGERFKWPAEPAFSGPILNITPGLVVQLARFDGEVAICDVPTPSRAFVCGFLWVYQNVEVVAP